MIIAGIDEAGLGSKLGPLIVSSSAFRISDSYDLEINSLWDIFTKTTTSKKAKNDKRLLITDSKIAYNAKGVAGLKDVVINFLRAHHNIDNITNSHELISLLEAQHQIDNIKKSIWFSNISNKSSSDPRLKLDPASTFDLKTNEAKILLLRSRILTAQMLNNLFQQGLNKSEVLLLQTGTHIKHIIDTYTDQKIKIIVDKQGGKTYYAPFLIDILAGEWIETIRESAQSSLYKIRDNIYIEFTPKADQKEFTVALASIISKFLREILMDDFNTFFTGKVPNLKPTAGYPEDAKRFFADLTDYLIQAKIDKYEIWRER